MTAAAPTPQANISPVRARAMKMFPAVAATACSAPTRHRTWRIETAGAHWRPYTTSMASGAVTSSPSMMGHVEVATGQRIIQATVEVVDGRETLESHPEPHDPPDLGALYLPTRPPGATQVE